MPINLIEFRRLCYQIESWWDGKVLPLGPKAALLPRATSRAICSCSAKLYGDRVDMRSGGMCRHKQGRCAISHFRKAETFVSPAGSGFHILLNLNVIGGSGRWDKRSLQSHFFHPAPFGRLWPDLFWRRVYGAGAHLRQAYRGGR